MSRRAIISDIHGNLVALEAVLADIKTQNLDEIVCLGDICGYGPQPIECIQRVRETCSWVLMGNHDEALFVEPKDFGKNARIAVEWQRTILEPKAGSSAETIERWNWLKNLSAQRHEKDVLFVHASPRDPMYEYVLKEDFQDIGAGPSQKALDIFACMEWLAFCGHSHRPGVVAEDFQWRLPADLPSGYVVSRGFKTLVNVGSVGQPRDGIPSSCYCIFEYDPPDHTKSTKMAAVAAPNALFSDDDAPPAASAAAAADTTAAAPAVEEEIKPNEETKFSEELTAARDTAMLKLPRVRFRRVEYDIEEAQARFRAVPELPEANGTRLAKGL